MRNYGTFFKKLVVLTVLLSAVLLACKKDPPMEEPPASAFDRGSMLEHWADNIILPALRNYQEKLNGLDLACDAFVADQQSANLSALRTAWLHAYLAWQSVSMFDIGKAEAIGLRRFTNIFPTDVDEIESNLSKADVNLELPSTFDAQGFPALDYMLFGVAESDKDILSKLSQEESKRYLSLLVDRLVSLTDEVVSDWDTGYREEFVSADGASATASTDKMVNDFLFYYERFLRAGKVGIPAGVFSGSKVPDAVEGRFSRTYSKELFVEALRSVRDFFNGQGPNSRGVSLKDYVVHASQTSGQSDLEMTILNHWNQAQMLAEGIDRDFQRQIEQDNVLMLSLYDELQKAVILLKVDMMQALNIQVDYVDADGD